MGLRPQEFEHLQPQEFFALLDGYRWRKEREEDTQAYFTHWIVNAFVTKPITPADILKPLREGPGEKKRTTVEELQEKFKKVLG